MGELISMAEYKAAEVKPKSEARRHKGHSYQLLFRPSEPDLKKRWGWLVKYTRVYEFSGSAATIELAARDAMKEIDHREGRSERAASGRNNT